MKFAVLADIHGNSAALAAVLADMDQLGVAQAVNLGDYVSGPLDAAGTADILMPLGFPSIRGNHDRWVLQQEPEDMGPSDRCAFDQLTQAQLDWLGSMPPTMMVFDEVFLCHATPTDDLTYWLDHVEETGATRSATLEEMTHRAQGIDASLILCGHTHIPRCVRLLDGRIILNPGSVGCPAYDDDVPVHHVMQTGTPNASYAIAEKRGVDWLIAFRSVPYDAAPMLRLAELNNRPDWHHALATGWMAT